MRQQILEAEVQALRAEVKRLRAATEPPAPLPSLELYASDPAAVADVIRRRGIHASEVAWLADYIEVTGREVSDLLDEVRR